MLLHARNVQLDQQGVLWKKTLGKQLSTETDQNFRTVERLECYSWMSSSPLDQPFPANLCVWMNTLFPPPTYEVSDGLPCPPSFHMGSVNPNAGPHACTASPWRAMFLAPLLQPNELGFRSSYTRDSRWSLKWWRPPLEAPLPWTAMLPAVMRPLVTEAATPRTFSCAAGHVGKRTAAR